MQSFQVAVYLLCMITSFVVMLLLLRGYRQNSSRLLLWSALAFVAFTLNNLFLFVDIVVLPEAISLLPLRNAAALIGVCILLYGFIWEID